MVAYKKPTWIVVEWPNPEEYQKESKNHNTTTVEANTAEQALRCIKVKDKSLIKAYTESAYKKEFACT